MQDSSIDTSSAPGEGETVRLFQLGVRFLIDGGPDGRQVQPRRASAAGAGAGRAARTPHAREDEYSFVLEGRIGLQIGDELIEAGPGDLVLQAARGSRTRSGMRATSQPGCSS